MSRTHHATRTWRLSCGCLRDYPGMPLGKAHRVLCPACNVSVTTLYDYPDDRCGFARVVDRPDGEGLTHVSCTRTPGHRDCERGLHYDQFVQVKYKAPPRLRSSRQGQVSRP